MSAPQEARRAVQAFMNGENTVYTGSFEAMFSVMFGPLKHDAHVRAFRAHEYYTDQKRRIDAGNVEMRAWLAERGVTVC